MARTRTTPRPRDSAPQKTKPEPLHWGWRIALVVIAIALLGAAYDGWWNAPETREFAPQATAANATAQVEVRSETITVLLIGLAVFCIVIAANGRKLASVKLGAGEFTADTEKAAGEAGGKAEEKAKAAGLDAATARNAAKKAQAKVYAEAATRDVNELDLDVIADSAVEEMRVT